MLVLTRRCHEQIIINGNIVITVIEVGNGKCRLGFEAPSDVIINRSEVQASIDRGETSRPAAV